MSWFLRSVQSNDSDSSSQPRQFQSHSPPSSLEHSSNTTPPASVKDDLSAIRITLGRQLRGVATFLAPPPSPSTATATADSLDSLSSSQTIVGIRNDLVEIGGSLRTSLSLLSNNSNKAVGEISRLTSNFLRFQNNSDEEEEQKDEDESVDDVPGVTDEVLDFVNEMSLRPECWTDFPLPIDDTDFEMSDVQRVHATTIQQLAPDFSALREKLQKYMNDEQFWMIYFILLLPRLDEHDFELMSTPKIVKARDILLQNLAHKKNAQAENSERALTNDSQEGGMPSGEKASSDEFTTKTQVSETHEEEKIRQWLEEVEIDRETKPNARQKLESEEDISFSDLEDDENDDSSRIVAKNGQSLEMGSSSPNESSDWVWLNGSSGGKKTGGDSKERDSEGDESSDWLNIDDFD